jgi:hypothetical protein
LRQARHPFQLQYQPQRNHLWYGKVWLDPLGTLGGSLTVALKEAPMNNDVRKIKEHLRLDFECVADWRRRKAQEYPDDRRYVEAAQELDVLALTVDRVAPEILTVYAELFEDGGDDDEKHDEMLRGIGFSSSYSSATEYVQKFIGAQTGGH